MAHPTIIDIGTGEDAGFWLAALPFARFPVGDHAGVPVAPASAVSIVPHDGLNTPTLAAPSSGTPHNLSHGDPA